MTTLTKTFIKRNYFAKLFDKTSCLWEVAVTKTEVVDVVRVKDDGNNGPSSSNYNDYFPNLSILKYCTALFLA